MVLSIVNAALAVLIADAQTQDTKPSPARFEVAAIHPAGPDEAILSKHGSDELCLFRRASQLAGATTMGLSTTISTTPRFRLQPCNASGRPQKDVTVSGPNDSPARR